MGAHVGVTRTSLWGRRPVEHHEGSWGAVGYRISIRNLFYTFMFTLHLKFDSRGGRKQRNQCRGAHMQQEASNLLFMPDDLSGQLT